MNNYTLELLDDQGFAMVVCEQAETKEVAILNALNKLQKRDLRRYDSIIKVNVLDKMGKYIGL